MDQRAYGLTLTIGGVDLHNEATDRAIAKQFPNMMWGSHDGVTQVTLICHTDNPIQEALQLATRISERLGATKIRWDDDFVDCVMIARRTASGQFETGADISRVQDWQKNAVYFPATCGTLGVGKGRVSFWRWTDITTWLSTQVEHQERYKNITDLQELTEHQIALLNGELAKLDAP